MNETQNQAAGAQKQGKKKTTGIQKSTEYHRYGLAMLLIGGFLVIMFAGLIGAIFFSYAGMESLAATFSGWITAVIGFYFLQQNTERAQLQSRDATRQAAVASQEVVSATKKVVETTNKASNLYDKGKAGISDLEKTIKEQADFIDQLVTKIQELKTGG
jgi:methyl-accepting chemotaxis protein